MLADLGHFSALGANVENSNRLSTKMLGQLTLCAAALAMLLAAGCGGGGTSTTGTGPVQGENSLVTVVGSSAANDQITRFTVQLTSLVLTDKAGTSVSLISAPQQVEFMHLNGNAEPIVTVSVPQDVYTSATATVQSATFVCAAQVSGSDSIAEYAASTNPATVQLPQPLTVDGTTTALSLQLLVSQSASFPSTCYTTTPPPISVTPTFNLTAMTVSAQPTNAANGRMTALEGLVQAVSGANTFTVTAADSVPNGGTSNPTLWRLSTSGTTVFQGTGNVAGLAAGMPVDMDGNLQSDGSVLATRVAVLDPNTTDLTVNSGPLFQIPASIPLLDQLNQIAEGSQLYINGWPVYSFGNATTFATWDGLTNVASLPFSASFTAANMVPGQMTSVTSHVTSVGNYPTFVPATVVTLMPQTIDATVSAVTTQGNFTEYTVTLAPYDFFPQFAVQAGQTTLLTNPQQVVVYADSNAQVLSTPAAGSTARFTGVIFNDNGTLRMDCTQVSPGVTE